MIHQSASALQAAIEAINIAEQENPAIELIAAKCRGLMRGYHARWHGQEIQVLAVEQIIESGLVNPDTNASSRTFTTAGKIDVDAIRNGKKLIVDHKSTSQDIEDPNAPFWRQLAIDGQATHYMLMKWLNGDKVDECMWDVMRKPGIAPKAVTKAQQKSCVATGEYCGSKLSQATLDSLQVSERETMEMYEHRLAHDCTHERPEHYFQRRTIPRLDNEIIEYARELWGHGQDIIARRNSGRHPRNPGACMLYNSPCTFLGICSGHDSPDSDRWKRKEQVHNELTIEGDGKNVLTNSRIRCSQTCPRKHELQYELGIERHDAEDREALVFGTVWHTALEAWFNYFKDQQA